MNFEYVVKTRTATRKFQSRQVDRETLTKILEIGRLAPTAKNMQPQRILVVQSEEGLKKIDAASPCRYNAPTVLVVCADKNSSFKKGDYSSIEMDASIVATHLVLGATNYGVDNIWILMFDKETIKREFNLYENIEPICLIPIGYKAEDCPANPFHNIRKELTETTMYI